MDPAAHELDRKGLVERLDPMFGDRTLQAIGAYQQSRPGASDRDIWNAVLTDRMFRDPAVRMAEQQSKHAHTFMYLFSWPTPVMDGQLGSCHGLEIAFVFNNIDRGSLLMPPVTPAMKKLSEEMHAAWAAFAHTGDPNHSELPEWTPYDIATRSTMVFDEKSVVVDDLDRERPTLWD
jgi:para-nitrobenzyl esterase